MTVERPRRSGLFAPRRFMDDARRSTPDATARRRLGPLAAALAAAFAIVTASAIAVAFGRDYPAATTLAWFAIAGTVVSFVLGAVAVVLDRGRRWGAAAMAVSVLANPLVLRLILGIFDPTT